MFQPYERCSLTRSLGESPEYRAQIEPAIEQVLHLTAVAMSVLPEAEGMVGTGQRRLDVAQRGC